MTSPDWKMETQLTYYPPGSDKEMKTKRSDLTPETTFRELRLNINRAHNYGLLEWYTMDGQKIDDNDIPMKHNLQNEKFVLAPVTSRRSQIVKFKAKTRVPPLKYYYISAYHDETIGDIRDILESQHGLPGDVLISQGSSSSYDNSVLLWDLDLSQSFTISFRDTRMAAVSGAPKPVITTAALPPPPPVVPPPPPAPAPAPAPPVAPVLPAPMHPTQLPMMQMQAPAWQNPAMAFDARIRQDVQNMNAQLTAEQRAAVDRLVAMNFPQIEVVQILSACDFNEETARNCLNSIYGR